MLVTIRNFLVIPEIFLWLIDGLTSTRHAARGTQQVWNSPRRRTAARVWKEPQHTSCSRSHAPDCCVMRRCAIRINLIRQFTAKRGRAVCAPSIFYIHFCHKSHCIAFVLGCFADADLSRVGRLVNIFPAFDSGNAPPPNFYRQTCTR